MAAISFFARYRAITITVIISLSLFLFFLAGFGASRSLASGTCLGRRHFEKYSGVTPSGFLLYGIGDQTIYLSTVDGVQIKKWSFPGANRIREARLNAENGDLTYTLTDETQNLLHPKDDFFAGWISGSVIWADFWGKPRAVQSGLKIHHWIDALPNGNVIAPYSYFEENEGKKLLKEFVAEIDPLKGVVRKWSTAGLIKMVNADPKSLDPLHLNRAKYYSHNPINGRPILLLSFRNTDTLAMMDFETSEIIWQMSGLTRGQHDPTLLASGNIAVFDNGTDYKPVPYSRLVLIDPRKNQIVKVFQGAEFEINGKAAFYSPYMSFALVTETDSVIAVSSKEGNYFAVDSDFDQVSWAGKNPYFRPTKEKGFGLSDRILFASYLDQSLLDRLPISFAERWGNKFRIAACRILLP